MTTPNDPLFGSTPQSVLTALADGSYAKEMLDRSDERIIPTEANVAASAAPAQAPASAPAGAPQAPGSQAPAPSTAPGTTAP